MRRADPGRSGPGSTSSNQARSCAGGGLNIDRATVFVDYPSGYGQPWPVPCDTLRREERIEHPGRISAGMPAPESVMRTSAGHCDGASLS